MRLSDGDPDGFTFVLGFDNLLFQAVNPDAAVEDFADFAVTANEDASFGDLYTVYQWCRSCALLYVLISVPLLHRLLPAVGEK